MNGHLEGTSVGIKIKEQEGSRTPPGDGTVVAVISFLLRELSLGAVAFILTVLALPLGAVLLAVGHFLAVPTRVSCRLLSSLAIMCNISHAGA